MRKKLINKLNNSFKAIYDRKETLLNFENYYIALVSWVKENMNILRDDIENEKRLLVLLDINPHDYVVENPELSLSLESKRLGSRQFETIAEMLMSIDGTLWDMVTIGSGKDCPNCIDDELRYVIAEDKSSNLKEVILECDTCGWTEHMNGKKWEEGIVNILPANKEDIGVLN